MEPAAHLAQRRGAWDVFHELVDQILTSGREGEPPGEELIASLRDFAARRAATGASAMVARTRQDDDGDRELDSRDPKRSRAGPPTCPDLMEWSDEELLNLLVRVPFAWHHELRAVCRKFNDLVKSDEFCQMRVESKYAEHGCVFAGGVDDSWRLITSCMMVADAGRDPRRAPAWRDPRAPAWRQRMRARPIAPLASVRAHAASVVFEGELFVLGGNVDRRGTLTNTVEVYNPRTNSWRSCAPMSEPRSRFATGIVGGRVVVAGGLGRVDDRIAVLDTAEAYDPTTETWTPLPPLPHATEDAAACVLNGCLFVAGGSGADGADGLIDHLQMYDGTGWTLKAPLPTVRMGGCMVAYDGRLVIFGGQIYEEDGEWDGELRQEKNLLTYDPITNTWENQPPQVDGIYDLVTDNSVAWESSGKLHLINAVTGNGEGDLVVFEKGTQGGPLVGSLNFFRTPGSLRYNTGGRLLLG